MSLLGIFKRKQAEASLDDLDIPPPPPVGSEGEDLGMASIGEEMPEPNLPNDLPEFPDQTEKEKPSKFAEQPGFFETPEKETIREKKLFDKGLKPESGLKSEKPLFVSLNDYRDVLNNINLIKNSLKEAESSISNINSIKADEDKGYDKWQKSLHDVHKDLIFVDKILFKG